MRIIPLRAGLDPLALLLALVSPLQSLAEFLGAVAFHRPPPAVPSAAAGGSGPTTTTSSRRSNGFNWVASEATPPTATPV